MMLDFNVFTFNSRVFPAPSRCSSGAATASRPHRQHQHGLAPDPRSRATLQWTGTDGGPLPATAWIPETTINVPPGTTRDVEFVADNPGDWAFHCHKVHHTMNQMGHNLPIMTGVDQSGVDQKLSELVPGYMPMGGSGMGDMPDMGKPRNSLLMGSHEAAPRALRLDLHGRDVHGLKVREGLRSYAEDPGWYDHPAGSVASAVGARQAQLEPAWSPRRPLAALAALGPDATFQAVKAGSCASPDMGRR
jgi:hypothetical protein